MRQKCSRPLPMAWVPCKVGESSIIEVYPAATLRVLKIEVCGYKDKKADGDKARQKLLGILEKHVNLPNNKELLLRSDDAIDAVVCVLSGAEFLKGNVRDFKEYAPQIIKKEGWIWFPKDTNSRGAGSGLVL